MEVLYNGRLHEEDLVLTCTGFGHGVNGCGSILKVNANDISVSHAEDHFTIYEFRCPVCDKITEIPHDLISADALRKLNGWK